MDMCVAQMKKQYKFVEDCDDKIKEQRFEMNQFKDRVAKNVEQLKNDFEERTDNLTGQLLIAQQEKVKENKDITTSIAKCVRKTEF